MIGYIGNILITICLLASLIQSSRLIQDRLIIDHKLFTSISFFSILISFLLLVYLFINSNFNYEIVVSNSHSEKPLIYKIAGAWGNHEGSLLFWIFKN